MNELVTAENYSRIGIGTRLSYPGQPGKYAEVIGLLENPNYRGQWEAVWSNEKYKRNNNAYYELKFLLQHKYYFIKKKYTLIIG